MHPTPLPLPPRATTEAPVRETETEERTQLAPRWRVILHNDDKTTFRIVPGACRHFCSMGPNVYVNGQHFTEVQSLAACESIAHGSNQCDRAADGRLQ